MNIRTLLSTIFLKSAIRILCRVDSGEMKKIPLKGPGIIVINHINFLEVPLIQVCMHPRKMHGLVKKETWNNPFLRFFLNTYGAIPVDRGGVNKQAFADVKKALDDGAYICIAPEGTRSGDGILKKGRSGITAIALMNGVPVIPVAHRGGENIWRNMKRLKRTDIILKVGKPFIIKNGNQPGKETREKITEEIMYQLAGLLPEEMRGVYSTPQDKPLKYVKFVQE